MLTKPRFWLTFIGFKKTNHRDGIIVKLLMEKILSLLKSRPFLYVVSFITLSFNLIGLIDNAIANKTLNVEKFIELLLVITLYVFIFYALNKKKYPLFRALLMILFSFDSFLLLMESGDELVESIKEGVETKALVASANALDLLASILVIFSLTVYIIEIYTSSENLKLFKLGKYSHLIASIIFIVTFILHMIYCSNHVEVPFEPAFYSVSFTFSPLAILSLTLNTNKVKY